jgi:diguanylate cyclase (GGDEF)-like protein/PAS domain S-box-containing protein
MTLSSDLSGPVVEPRVIRKQYAMEMAVERTRLLYQGSLLPTLLMLLNGLVCAALLWSPQRYFLVSVWLVWLLSLVALRVIQVAAFDSAIPNRQANPVWGRMFLLGSGLTGLTLAGAGIALVPADNFIQQAWVFGLIGAAALSASVAYAVSLPAFLSFTLPCLLPAIAYMFWGGEEQQGWGWFGLILLGALSVVAWQVNRLIDRGLLRRFQNQALIEHLQQAQSRSEQLNQKLANEVEQRRRAEDQLRQVQVELQSRVAQRSLELDAANQALSKSEARLALALEASEQGLWDWNLQTDEVHHTQIQELFGLDPQYVTAMLRHLKPRLHPEDLPVLRRALVEHLKGRTEDYQVEYRVRHGDGHWVWIEDRGRAVERSKTGRVIRMVGTRRDISVNKALEEQQQLAATVFEAASEGIVIFDPDYNLIAVNQSFSRVTGYEIEEILGRNVAELPFSRDARRHYGAIHQALEQLGNWQGELVETRKNGEMYPQWLQLNAVRDSRGHVSHIVGFFADLSARRESEERMRYLTHYDELTGLANRSLFRERLNEAHQRVRQGGFRSLALLHINLDRFKLLNDSLGHEIADHLLQKVARRLVNALPEADTIARLSGDEFAVLFNGYGSLSSLARVATRLSAKLRVPVTVDGHELVVSASMGISLLPDNAREISALVSQSNMAMQHAKHLGGNNFQFYTDSLQTSTLERLQLENQLRKALDEKQLKVYYQPKLCLATGRLNAAEALVRWDHPTMGRVPPGDFIGLAEETGLIGPIGEFVLRQACWQACEWQRDGLEPIRVSVNLSVHQLRQGKLVSLVRQVLEETGLAPHLLELELTESQLLDSVEHIIATFQQLHDLGVKLAIDDFGTGYSSLSYLKRIPVDYVKIDQAFIRGLGQGTEDAAITRAIIAMAHGLSLRVVAEGVERQEQLEFLRGEHCDEVQGYLISRPVEADDLARLLADQVRVNEREAESDFPQLM